MEKNQTNQSEIENISEGVVEEILDEIADLEEYAARGEKPPRCRGYRIRVNRERYEIFEPNPTREVILETAGLTPTDEWTLRMKIRGGKPELIEPGERVDLTRPGVEKFKALPRDQTEGDIPQRRQFDLTIPESDFLGEYSCPWETITDGSQWVLLHNFSTQHPGYNHEKVIAAIRLETGYPKAPLDMVYFYPTLQRKDGKPIAATQVIQQIDGRSFQRWSRHRTSANPWIIGQDDLSTHILMIEDWLRREFEK